VVKKPLPLFVESTTSTPTIILNGAKTLYVFKPIFTK